MWQPFWPQTIMQGTSIGPGVELSMSFVVSTMAPGHGRPDWDCLGKELCCAPGCPYIQHGNPGYGNYCCKVCHENEGWDVDESGCDKTLKPRKHATNCPQIYGAPFGIDKRAPHRPPKNSIAEYLLDRILTLGRQIDVLMELRLQAIRALHEEEYTMPNEFRSYLEWALPCYCLLYTSPSPRDS